MDRKDRFAIAERLRRESSQVAEDVTDAFLHAHPDWFARYGPAARIRGVEDAAYHVSFLAAAIESGAPDAFADYARWTARVLEARGIHRAFLLENLRQVGDAFCNRIPDAPIEEYLLAAITALGAPPDEGTTGDEGEGLALTRSMYVQALLASQRNAALTIVTEAIKDGASAIDVYVEVLQEALYRIGGLWERNEITVAHEHAATAITQFVAAQLYGQLDRTGPRRGTLLITGVEGEWHSVGALMVADVLEANGWTVHFLGTSLPHRAIVDAIRQHDPVCIGISATMIFNVAAVRRLIDAVRLEWGAAKRLIVGGSAFRSVPDLWRDVGADGYAKDLREALDIMGRQDR